MQLNQKTREGPQHRNRDQQFRYINRQVASFRKSGDPVLSVDTKKKELVGPFKNGGADVAVPRIAPPRQRSRFPVAGEKQSDSLRGIRDRRRPGGGQRGRDA